MKRALIFLHKWLGVALALLFLMWFASGIVLYYVPFPNLGTGERLAGLAPLALPPAGTLTAAQAAERAGLRPSEARLGMLAERPVWRLLARGAGEGQRGDGGGGPGESARPRWQVVDAVSGQLLAPLTDAESAAVAEAFSGRRALGAERLDRDQWTVPQGLDPYRPLVKVRLDGDDGLELYVAPGSAEVVRDTRRAERFWNWLGAVPHWIYPTLLRQYPKAWHQVVVWLSLPGVLLAASGLALGLWQLFLNPRRWIPYRVFWLRWHHIGGLVGAVFTLTWIFSGLLSMNPFGVFPGRGAATAERARWQGPPAEARLDPGAALALAAAQGVAARELDLLQVAGQAWYRLRDAQGQRLVRADAAGDAPAAVSVLPEPLVSATLAGLRAGEPAAGTPTLRRLEAYDDLYYSRDPASTSVAMPHGNRPLPVWRAEWADGVAAYADPASGRIVLRADEAGRWQRVLYHGLHSLDFAPLLARPALRDALVVGLSLLGLALSVTGCVIAWRVLVPRQRGADVRVASSASSPSSSSSSSSSPLQKA